MIFHIEFTNTVYKAGENKNPTQPEDNGWEQSIYDLDVTPSKLLQELGFGTSV